MRVAEVLMSRSNEISTADMNTGFGPHQGISCRTWSPGMPLLTEPGALPSSPGDLDEGPSMSFPSSGSREAPRAIRAVVALTFEELCY